MTTKKTATKTKAAAGSTEKEGKVTSWAAICFLIGVVVFLINMGLAWKVMFDTRASLTKPMILSGTNDSPNLETLSATFQDMKANELAALTRTLDNNIHLKAISNKQSLVVVTMASAFSLVAIGFALFVMGIEGSFRFNAESQQLGKILLASGSPGLACFLFAGIILSVAVTQKTSLDMRPMTLQPESSYPQLPTFDSGTGSRLASPPAPKPHSATESVNLDMAERAKAALEKSKKN
ncbi:MAG: hypothetical protein AAF585_09615 [Verrucomicrobiota bacterium]